MKITSLRWRVIIPTSLILIAVFLFLQYSIAQSLTQSQTKYTGLWLSSEAKHIQFEIESKWLELAAEENFQTPIDNWSKQLNSRITLISSSGTILAESDPNPPEDTHLFRTEFQAALNSSGEPITYFEDSGNLPTFFVAIPIIHENETKGIIRIAYPVQELELVKDSNRNSKLTTITIILLLSILPLIILTTKYGRRLEQIKLAINEIAHGNRNVMIETGLRDEVGIIAHDINQLAKNLQEEFQLIQSEQAKLNAVLTQMNDGVIILDNNGLIILANQAALNLFNFTDINVEGLRMARVIRYHQIIEMWQDFQETGDDQADIIELPDINKSIQTFLSPLGPNLPGYTLFIFQDLTKLRQLEKIRRDFISNISHELRTPLASLKALAETLQISAIDDPGAAERFLKRMDTEIDALAQMVSELLELSRIESGQVPIELSPTDANKILQRVSDRLVIQADRATIKIQTKYQPYPTLILVDKTRIEQVLVNILHNAIKFSPPNSIIQCSLNVNNEEAIFEIKDNGSGISSEDLPRIFERFYKSKRQNSGSGTGLGLSIAKHLTEANHGRIWVESQFGEGTTFFVAFKRHKP